MHCSCVTVDHCGPWIQNVQPKAGVPSVRATPKRSAVALASAGPNLSTITITPHPDALRRRREAEARQQQHLQQAQDTLRSFEGKLATDAPENMLSIHTPSELDFRIKAHSRDDKLVVVHFKGNWCTACARMQYKLKQIAMHNQEITFMVVDLADEELFRHSASMGVNQLPYFHLYKNGDQVAKFTCNLATINLLRAEIAAHKKVPGAGPDAIVYSAMVN